MRLSFLGAAGEVGRSAVLLESDKRVLLDYGVKLGERVEYPMPVQGGISAYVPSHAHLDHCGFSPALFEHDAPPVFATYPTMALSSLLIKDSMKVTRIRGERMPYSTFSFRKFESSFIPLSYGKPFQLTNQTSITLHDAGHIPGAAIVDVRSQRRRVVYTGDFKLEETRLHRGADFVEKVDVLVMESTYSNREHPERKSLERKLVYEIRTTLESGGNVLLPSFAVGRSQELLILMADLLPDADVFLDGMSRAATRIIMDYPSYVKDAAALRRGARNARWVESDAHRRKALERPSVIISSAGMLEGGPALSYLLKLNPRSKVILTGYQIPGTNARMLVDERKVEVDGIVTEIDVPVEYLDMSAHAGRKELLEFVRRANPEKVFCVHGDWCEEFARELREMGYDAHAPKLGKSYEV